MGFMSPLFVGALAVIALLDVAQAASTASPEPYVAPVPARAHNVESPYVSVTIPGHPVYAGRPLDVEARITFKEALPRGSVNQVLLGFNSLSSNAQVQFLEVQYEADGTEVLLAKDERVGLKPTIFLLAEDLPPTGQALLMKARVTLKENGQFHLGVLVIAFDHQWQKLSTPDHGPVETYAYSIVKGDGAKTARPFVGMGNQIPGPGPAIVIALVAALAAVLRRPR